jgi:hypothetical protein
MDKISASCRLTYRAYHKSGTRSQHNIKLIVLHSTEGGGSAAAVARYFTSASSGGSAHLVLDDNACYRCLRNIDIPWGAPGANEQGFHIEQLGYAAWTQKQWLAHEQMLDRAAYKIAYHAHLFKIPLVFLTAAGLKAGKRGVTTHAEVSKAWHKTDHSDPGSGYPIKYVLALAKKYLEGMEEKARPEFYTYRKDAEADLRPGEEVGYKRGHGYYIRKA